MPENRSLDQIFASKPLIDRTWFRVLMAAILVLVFGAGISYAFRGTPAEPPPRVEAAASVTATPKVPRQPTLAEMMEWRRVHQPLYDRIVRVTEEAAKGDAVAERLATLLRERTHLAQIFPGGVTYAMWDGAQSQSRAAIERMTNSSAVVLATRAEIGYFPHPPDAAFFFSRGDLNFVDAWQYADWYLGVLVLHELSHWDDIVVSNRELHDSPMFSDVWTDGELRAHAIETRAIDRHTLGRFHAALEETLADSRLTAPANGAPLLVPTEEGWNNLMLAFGDAPKSAEENGERGGSLLAAFLMLQTGDTGPAARAAYNWMVQTGGT